MTAIKLLLGRINIYYVLIGLVFYCSVITLLWFNEKARHKLTVSEYATLSAKRQVLNEVEQRNREKITSDVVTSYANSINEVKDYYAKNPTIKHSTVRVRDNSCNGMPKTRESASTVNSETNGINQVVAAEPSREVQINLPKASAEIVQCVELIEFSKKQEALSISP